MHCLADGRDTEDVTAVLWLERLKHDLDEMNAESNGTIDAKIALVRGRMLVTMDRYESDWEIVQRGWDAHI